MPRSRKRFLAALGLPRGVIVWLVFWFWEIILVLGWDALRIRITANPLGA